MFKLCKKPSTSASANVVDGKLILSLPEALTPIVWQMDLSDAKASAFEVIEQGGNFSLTSKKQGSEKKDTIATFATRSDSVDALMATSHALASAHGHIRTEAANINAPNNTQAPQHTTVYHTQKPKGGAGKWIIAIVCLLVILGLFTMMNSMKPRLPSSVDNAGGFSPSSSTSQSGGGNNDAANAAGVPVSADDYLMKR